MDHAHHHTAKDQAVSGASREQSPARHTPALSLDGGPGGGASSTGASPEPDAPPSPHQLLPRASTSKRLALARRLEVLARQVADGDPEVDERTLTGQVDLLEEALGREPGTRHRRSDGLGPRSLSDQGGALLLSTAGPSHTHTHTRFSSLSSSLLASAPEPEPDRTRDAPTRGVFIRRANKVISELTKLNEELTIVVENLRARQEESQVRLTFPQPARRSLSIPSPDAYTTPTPRQHIHGLLIERAENAARRIIFLQDRISYL